MEELIEILCWVCLALSDVGMVYKREELWKSLLCARRFLSLQELVVSLVTNLDLGFRHSTPEYIVPRKYPIKKPGERHRETQAEDCAFL